MIFLGYFKYSLEAYLLPNAEARPSYDFYELLATQHLETFHGAFKDTLRIGENNELEVAVEPVETIVPEVVPAQPETVLPEHDSSSAERPTVDIDNSADTIQPALQREKHLRVTALDSPTRSDEGYGSFLGESSFSEHSVHEAEESMDEIAALGIIEECDELPDYGVAMIPAPCASISPVKKPRRESESTEQYRDSINVSPTKRQLEALSKPVTTGMNRSASTKRGQDAKNVLAMGYTLALLGERFDKARSIEGSVKSVIIKAAQAIERGSQAGSVYGKSRYGGSRYGGSRYAPSRYAGSKFGGSKLSVAKSIVLDETLPSWGF